HLSSTVVSTLSLHDALPISGGWRWDSQRQPGSRRVWGVWRRLGSACAAAVQTAPGRRGTAAVRREPSAPWIPPATVRASFSLTPDRKSTRLNSSHRTISYAV